MVKINIERKYLYSFSLAIILITSIIAVYAYAPLSGTANPATMGHSINELDGTGPALSPNSFTGTQRGSLILNVAFSNGVRQSIDFIHTIGSPSNPVARIASRHTNSGSYLSFGTSNNYGSGITNEALTIDPVGNVGIGNNAPTSKLNVNGDIIASGRIDNGNGCTLIASHSLAGLRRGTVAVPAACINNECLIVLASGPNYAITKYEQASYDYPSGGTEQFIGLTIWSAETPVGIPPASVATSSDLSGKNGDSISKLIVYGDMGSTNMALYDDVVGQEILPNQWTWQTQDTGFALIACY